MSNLKLLKVFACVLLSTFFLMSCQKDLQIRAEKSGMATEMQAKSKPVLRPYKDAFDTYYQFIPDVANGWVAPNPGPAWYPGGGEGNVAHMGKALTYFNQYASLGPTGFGSVAAPVNMFFASQLSAIGLAIPGNVSSIVFDKKGNSIWFRLMSNTTIQESDIRVNFTGDVDIVGGTGKFEGATGKVKLSGYFNPQNPGDAGVSNVGNIVY